MRELAFVLVPILVYLGARAVWQNRGRGADARWRASSNGTALLAGEVAVVRAAQAQTGTARAALALANVEGRRLVAHPVFIALGVLIALPQIALFALDPKGDPNIAWIVLIWTLFLGSSAMIAANLGALRSRRERTEELFASEPVSPPARTVGHLVSAAWAAGGAALLIVALAALAPAIGKTVTFDPGERFLPSFDLAQLPLFVFILAELGVLLARWIPSGVVAPVAAIALFATPGSWTEGGLRWLYPVVFSEGRIEPSAAMAWHVPYLIGLAVLLGSLAVLRHGWSRPVAIGLGAGAAVAVATGAIQLAVA